MWSLYISCYTLSNHYRQNLSITGNLFVYTWASLRSTPTQKDTTSEVIDAQQDSRPSLTHAISDYFPMIKRGGEEEIEGTGPEVVTSGWTKAISSRKDREESLR